MAVLILALLLRLIMGHEDMNGEKVIPKKFWPEQNFTDTAQ
jgi:hypothetical protein